MIGCRIHFIEGQGEKKDGLQSPVSARAAAAFSHNELFISLRARIKGSIS
jgi:hypothetical protein